MGCPCKKKAKKDSQKKYNVYDAIKEETLHRFGITESPYVSDVIREDRLKICMACEHFFALTKNCKKCGCFVKLKTKYKQSECPVGKWDRE